MCVLASTEINPRKRKCLGTGPQTQQACEDSLSMAMRGGPRTQLSSRIRPLSAQIKGSNPPAD